jgi:hypothetical protein
VTTNSYDEAADLLIFYMRRAWEQAGLSWEPDNSAEIRNLVDRLADGAREAAGEECRAHAENAPHIYADGSTS